MKPILIITFLLSVSVNVQAADSLIQAQTALRSIISGKSATIVPVVDGAPVEDGAARNQAPAFKLKGLDGKTISLSDYRGKYVLLDFFTTWCKYCKKAIPGVVEAQAKYGKKGLNIIIINKGESAATIKKYAANPWDEYNRPFKDAKGLPLQIKSPFLADPGSRISNQYLAFSIPTFVLIGPNGSIIDRGTGAPAKDRLIKKWKQLAGIK